MKKINYVPGSVTIYKAKRELSNGAINVMHVLIHAYEELIPGFFIDDSRVTIETWVENEAFVSLLNKCFAVGTKVSKQDGETTIEVGSIVDLTAKPVDEANPTDDEKNVALLKKAVNAIFARGSLKIASIEGVFVKCRRNKSGDVEQIETTQGRVIRSVNPRIVYFEGIPENSWLSKEDQLRKFYSRWIDINDPIFDEDCEHDNSTDNSDSEDDE